MYLGLTKGERDDARKDTDPSDAKRAEDTVAYWLKEIAASRSREKNWRKQGDNVLAIYEAGKEEQNTYNILYSNTDTLQPSLYSRTPRVVVKPRRNRKSPLAQLAAKFAQNTLTFLLDNPDPSYPSLDSMFERATTSALLPGRGLMRFKYDADIVETPPEEQKKLNEAQQAPEGKPIDVPRAAKVAYDDVCWEIVPWDKVHFGYARKWQSLPWVAFEHFMTEDEVRDNFGPVLAIQMKFVSPKDADEDDSSSAKAEDTVKGATIYEIWDKGSRRVYFVSPQLKEVVLRDVPDPLELQGFFPLPEQLTFLTKLNSLLPTPLYRMYQNQAEELNRITLRINTLIGHLKVRGVYDATVKELSGLFDANDGELVAATNVQALLSQGGRGLDNALWLMPIEKIVTVLQQLYLNRQQVKAVIFEISGIADIMRGSSAASETLGAQQIKQQWGTMRLKRMQRRVETFCRDSLRMLGELAFSKLTAERLEQMANSGLPLAAEKERLQLELQAIQQRAQMAATQAPPPIPGQPPAQLPAGPEQDPKFQQMMQRLQQPSVEDVVKLLQDDLQRNYTIDIETNSTIEPEAAEDKKDIAELLQAMGTFMQAIGPLIEKRVMPFEAAKAMLLEIASRYNLGNQFVEQIGAMQAPEQPTGGEKPGEKEALQAEAQLRQQQAAAEGQKLAGQLKLAQATHELELETLAQKREFQREQHQMRMAQLKARTQQMLLQAAAKSTQPAGVNGG